MKKWIGCIGLFALCLLTGCGREDKLLQYMDTEDLGMINTSEEAERANEQLDREDHLKWVYDKKEIDELVQLVQRIKAEAKKTGCRVGEEALFGDGGVEAWKEHARQGLDPTKEKVSMPGLYIESETKEGIQKMCAFLEKTGFPDVTACIKKERVISRGLRFIYYYDEEEETYGHSLSIDISNCLGYYPEKYKKILDIFTERGYFVSEIQCFGGVVNGIVADRQEEESVYLCKEIFLQLDKEGKIVELNAFMDDSSQSKIKQETERKALVELLTLLTGEEKDVITFISDFTKKSGSGTVTKDYRWSVQRMWEEGYVLRVQ